MITHSLNTSLTRLQLSPTAPRLQRAGKIGVTLGAGIPEGLSGLGLLIGLKQLRISVDAVSGTSMGAFVAALFASGLELERIRTLAAERLEDEVLRREITRLWHAETDETLDVSARIADLFVELAGWDPEFHELKTPLFVVASDKKSQRPVVIRHGSVRNALRAALLDPAEARTGEGALKGGLLLADGSVLSPLPGDILYAEECDYVFGIHAKVIESEENREVAFKKQQEPHRLKMLGWEVHTDISFAKAGCDVLLRPRIPRRMLGHAFDVDELVDRGVEITYDAMNEIEQTEADLEASLVRRQERQELPEGPGLEEQLDELVDYLENVDQHVEGLTDAALMDLFPTFTRMFQGFWDRMILEYPDTDSLRAVLNERFPAMVDAINDSPFFKRCLEKPQGYAGDYQMMNYVYDDTVLDASSNLAKLFNYYIFDSPAANAVRNRAKIIHGVVQQRLALLGSLSIASIACGPAREIPTTMHLIAGMPGHIHWTLLDQDEDAMAYARSNIPEEDRLTCTFINAGVLDLVRGRVDTGTQDIIYSLGLFDYLADKVAIKVIAQLYNRLRPGGIMLIGNFTDHIIRPIMEAAMDWHLLYRTPEDCLRLAQEGAPGAQRYVMSEPAEVNLILIISKPID